MNLLPMPLVMIGMMTHRAMASPRLIPAVAEATSA
jgi:hypothetical protein